MRIKYYSEADMSLGYNFNNAIDILNNFDVKRDDYNINDIIEFLNIIKIVKDDYLKTFSSKEIEKYKSTLKILNQKIGMYAKSITEKNIKKEVKQIDSEYFEDFFEFFDKYAIYEKISSKTFLKLLEQKGFFITYALRNKNIVKYYNFQIRDYFLQNPDCAEDLLDEYEVDSLSKKIPLFFPKSLSLDDKEQVIINYINSEKANLNYLRIIENLLSTSDLKINDKTRLLAKRVSEKQESKLFNENNGFEMVTTVKFRKDLKETYIFGNDVKNLEITYNINWFEENRDFETLLNNFIYLFGYVDNEIRWSMVSKEQLLGIFEKSIFMRSKRDYPIGTSFNRLNQLADMQMIGYYRQLENLKIRLEDIIEWFFRDYLKREFNIENYIINMPSKKSSYLEKCRLILPELDSCLKQFSLYKEDGFIDQELLQMSSKPLLYDDIESLLNNKYVYSVPDNFNLISYYLFSDQCMLKYVKSFEEKYNSFYELILNENVTKEDISRHEQHSLNKLLEDDYIFIDKDNYIRFKNKYAIQVLSDIYNNEVLCYWKVHKLFQKEVDCFVSKGILKFENTLFSNPEQDYLNYYLNKSKFINSLDLRNIYSHGTQLNDNENYHYSNYIRFLRIFIMIIIKINDELCLKSEMVNKNS